MSRTTKNTKPTQPPGRLIRPKGLDRPVDFDLSESLSDSDEELTPSPRYRKKTSKESQGAEKATGKKKIGQKKESDDKSEEKSKATRKKKLPTKETSQEEEAALDTSEEFDGSEEEPDNDVDRIIGFSHHLTPAKGVITTAKFQPTRVVKKINLPTQKRKTVPKKEREQRGLIDRGFLVSNISSNRGIDENLKNEIERMGFAKVKALKRPALNRYYRMLEPGKGDAPSFTSNSEFAKFIFRRLGLSVDEKA